MSISIQKNIIIIMKHQGQEILIRFNLLYLICLKSVEWNFFHCKHEFIISLSDKTVFYFIDFQITCISLWLVLYLNVPKNIWFQISVIFFCVLFYTICSKIFVKLYWYFYINFQVISTWSKSTFWRVVQMDSNLPGQTHLVSIRQELINIYKRRGNSFVPCIVWVSSYKPAEYV